MCKQCVDAVRENFRDCPDENVGEFLLCATAYPAGGPEVVARQLVEHKAAGCLTWQAAIARADEEMDRVMKEISNRKAE